MELKDIVSYKRVRAGYSQKELAEKIGVSQQMVNAIEKGQPANSITLKNLADVFGCSADELLGITKTEQENV